MLPVKANPEIKLMNPELNNFDISNVENSDFSGHLEALSVIQTPEIFNEIIVGTEEKENFDQSNITNSLSIGSKIIEMHEEYQESNKETTASLISEFHTGPFEFDYIEPLSKPVSFLLKNSSTNSDVEDMRADASIGETQNVVDVNQIEINPYFLNGTNNLDDCDQNIITTDPISETPNHTSEVKEIESNDTSEIVDITKSQSTLIDSTKVQTHHSINNINIGTSKPIAQYTKLDPISNGSNLVNNQILFHLKNADDMLSDIEVSLFPAELGHIKIKCSVKDTVAIDISVEKFTTLNLLKENALELKKNILETLNKSSDTELNFSMSEKESHGDDRKNKNFSSKIQESDIFIGAKLHLFYNGMINLVV